MSGRSPQTHAKRARELAVKEKRELKRAKKAERAAAAAAQAAPVAEERTHGDQDDLGEGE
jgi:hypothetical protein